MTVPVVSNTTQQQAECACLVSRLECECTAAAVALGVSPTADATNPTHTSGLGMSTAEARASTIDHTPAGLDSSAQTGDSGTRQQPNNASMQSGTDSQSADHTDAQTPVPQRTQQQQSVSENKAVPHWKQFFLEEPLKSVDMSVLEKERTPEESRS